MIGRYYQGILLVFWVFLMKISFLSAVTDAVESVKTDIRPLVGAIRWDAWYGNVADISQLPDPKKRPGIVPEKAPLPDPGADVLRSLSPVQWEYRRPFFARHDEKGNLLELNGNRQEIMDQEIDYANYAGLDYWAFTVYPEDCPLSWCFKKYLASTKRNKIDFCFFLVLGSSYGRFCDDPAMQDYVLKYITEPGYLKVQGNRPVLYVGFFNEKIEKQMLDGFWRKYCDRIKAKGLGEPYIIICCNNPSSIKTTNELRKKLGADAIGAYTFGDSLSEGAPYRMLSDKTDKFVMDCIAQGVNVSPPCTTGWDRRPRFMNPVSWETWHKKGEFVERYIESGTPEEIANHIGRNVELLRRHPNKDGVNLILVYAWNECDEGGWLIPTLPDPRGQGTARIKALRKILRPETINKSPNNNSLPESSKILPNLSEEIKDFPMGLYSEKTSEINLPVEWLRDWKAPRNEHRPLQILHGWLKGWTTNYEPHTWDFSTFTHPAQDGSGPRGEKSVAELFREIGFGGVVCNVGGERYFRDEDQWKLLINAVKVFLKAGIRVWIYDEQGYPSLGGGGLVLEKNPKLESQALVFDKDLQDQGKNPFIVRPAFEYTHSANNVRVLRRYPNPLVPESTKLFIQCTHDEYRKRLGENTFRNIEAFFTDEPSIIAFNSSSSPGRTLPSMQGQIDSSVKNLPMLPWAPELPQLYKKEYNEDLLDIRNSLFFGDTDQDRERRLRFWKLVARLDRENFYGQIQDYLKNHGSSVPTIANSDTPLRLASSGHLLGEESVYIYIAGDGNKLANMIRMDLPGLDVLSSRPQRRNTLTAGMPCSAAFLAGRRLVMTEVSDMGDFRFIKPYLYANLDMMTATAVWQAAWGVTEFASYYRFENQGKEVFKAYGNYIGRLNAILRAAKPIRPVLLYLPIEELQKDFKPSALPNPVSKEFQFLGSTFTGLAQRLTKNQIPFTIIDQERFNAAKTVDKGKIELSGLQYDTIFIPCDISFKTDRIKAVRTTDSDYFNQIQQVRERFTRLEPQSDDIVAGQFEREGRTIWLFGNMDTEKSYSGSLVSLQGKNWIIMNPATGTIEPAIISDNKITVHLAPMQALLFVSEHL